MENRIIIGLSPLYGDMFYRCFLVPCAKIFFSISVQTSVWCVILSTSNQRGNWFGCSVKREDKKSKIYKPSSGAALSAISNGLKVFFLVTLMQENQSAIMEALVKIASLRGDSEPSANMAMEMERIAQLAVMASSCKDKLAYQQHVMSRIARFLSAGKKPVSSIRQRVMNKKISAYDVDIVLKAMVENGSVVEVDVNNHSNGRTTKNYALA